MKLLLVSGHRRFDKYQNFFRRLARRLAKELRQKGVYLELYLVGKEFMEKNVLAFPAPKGFPRPEIKLKPLGEIYLNPDHIKKEKPYADTGSWKSETDAKLAFMFIHGFLHLLGYDHKREGDRIIMEKRERQLLEKLSNS